MNKRVVIIGGGVSGLTAAYSISRTKRAKVTILESTDRFGGVIRTLHGDSFHMEAGADAFDGKEAAILGLCDELGLQDELLACGPTLRTIFISRKKNFLALDLFTPFTFFKSPALSFRSRARLLLEPFIPIRKEDPDESIAAFVRRRFGKTFLEETVRALARGVLMAEPEQLSFHEYFPRWQAMERERGPIWAVAKRENAAGRGASFFTLRGGLDQLIEALVKKLSGAGLERCAEVASLTHEKNWKIILRDGRTVSADAVCLAVPARQAAGILSGFAPSLAGGLRRIRYDSLMAVNMAFRRGRVPEKFFRSGFVVPSREKNWPFASLKLLGNTGDGKFVRCRAFFSGAFQPEAFDKDDEKIKKEILDLFGAEWNVRTAPELLSVERYPQALAQYEVGHGQLVSEIEGTLRNYPGLFLTGNGYHGFGISDCVREAMRTAQRIKNHLETSVETSA